MKINEKADVVVVNSSSLRKDGTLFRSTNITASYSLNHLNPLLTIDHFYITDPKFPTTKHMHCCIATYLFEDSEGNYISCTSEASLKVSKPGGLVWNIAGKGIVHEEYPQNKNALIHGLQVYFDLPTDIRDIEPETIMVNSTEIPSYSDDGVIVRIILGEYRTKKSLVFPPFKLTMLNVDLIAGKNFEFSFNKGENAIIYIVEDGYKYDSCVPLSKHNLNISKINNTLSIVSPFTDIKFVIFSGQRVITPHDESPHVKALYYDNERYSY